MGQVLGIGGVFLRCPDPEATLGWYQRVLGLKPEAFGGTMFSHAASSAAKGPRAVTVFAGFPEGTDYFDPSPQQVMINLMVDDLDAVLAHAAGHDVTPIQPGQDNELGRFAWILDLDGRKLELWQPPDA